MNRGGHGQFDSERAILAALAAIYTVQEGDTLWSIAERQLGDPLKWMWIWEANPQIENPFPR